MSRRPAHRPALRPTLRAVVRTLAVLAVLAPLAAAGPAASAQTATPSRPRASGPQVVVSPEVTDLGRVRADRGRRAVLTVTNRGDRRTAPLRVTTAASDQAPFLWRVRAGRCEGRRLAPGASCLLRVRYHAAAIYQSADRVRLRVRVGDGRTRGVAVLRARIVAASLTADPGTVVPAPPGVRTVVTLRNDGDGGTGRLVGGYYSNERGLWEVEDRCAERRLQPGASCRTIVRYVGPAGESHTLFGEYAARSGVYPLRIQVWSGTEAG